MKNLRRRWAIGVGAGFVVLVGGSWVAGRALAFPGPGLPYLRGKPLVLEDSAPLAWSSYPAFDPDRKDLVTGRSQVYDLGSDFDAAVEAVKRDVGSSGLGLAGPDGASWEWLDESATGRQGWRITLKSGFGGRKRGTDHLYLTVDSWRPRTRFDGVVAWVRAQIPKK